MSLVGDPVVREIQEERSQSVAVLRSLETEALVRRSRGTGSGVFVLRVLLLLTTAILSSCGTDAAPLTPPADQVVTSGRGDGDGASALAETPAETRYDGLTLDEWRERLKHLRFDTPEAGDAVPGLIAIIRDRDVTWHTRSQAALALGRIGEPAQQAVPVLVELLDEPAEDAGKSAQLWSVKALALFGPVARHATPALVKVLEDESRPHLVRLATLEALGRIGPAHPGTLPAIIEALQLGPAENETTERERQERRIAAAEVLELFRAQAAPAVPALIAASTNEHIPLRRAAVYTLGVIGPRAEPAVPALIDRLLFDDSEEVRDLAAGSLARIGPAAEPYLRQLLQDTEEDIRWRAALALGKLTPLDDETQTALTAALHDESARVRLLAAAALWNANGKADSVIGTITAELGNPDRALRMQSVLLLEQIGPTPQFGREDLQALLESGDTGTRQAARRILRSWDESGKTSP